MCQYSKLWCLPYWTFSLHVVNISVSDPEISQALNAIEITQNSVTLTWSIGDTHHIDMIQLYQREIDESGSTGEPWLSLTNTSSTSSHTVTPLRPGTKYEFYVQIWSYGKAAKTGTKRVTTGEATPLLIVQSTISCYVTESSPLNYSVID